MIGDTVLEGLTGAPDPAWDVRGGYLEEVTAQLKPKDKCDGCGLVGKEKGCAGGRNNMYEYPCVSWWAVSRAAGFQQGAGGAT